MAKRVGLWVAVGGSVALVILVVAAFVIDRGRIDEQPPLERAVREAPSDEDLEWLVGPEVSPDDSTPDARANGGSGGPSGPGGHDGTGAAAPGARRTLTDDDRRALLRDRVKITSLSDSPPAIEPEDIFASLREVRSDMGDCITQHGGLRALSAMMRGQADAGAARGFTIGFDVGTDGRVDAASVALDPPPPEDLYECFASTIGKAELPTPGPDGARVEVRFGGGRSRGH